MLSAALRSVLNNRYRTLLLVFKLFRLSKKYPARETVPGRSLCIGEELLQTECLIVYYISQAAKVGHPVAKEAVASLRNLIQV